MSFLNSIRGQIHLLEEQRFPRSHMRLRATRPGWYEIMREAVPDGAQLVLSDPPSIELVPLELIEGVLKTAYVWVPYRHFYLRQLPSSRRFLQLEILDADKRILDESILPVRDGPSFHFTPEQVNTRPRTGRVDIISSVKRPIK